MSWHQWQQSDSSPEATANADAIRAAIAERRPLCSHCFKFYTPHEHSHAEWFHARSILFLPDSEPNPMLCDDCFNRVVGTFNRHVTNIGTSNSAPTNLLLAQLG